MPRIFLHPGRVKSIHDGQYHFISAPKLAHLYGVKYDECHVIDYRRPETWCGIVEREGDIHLYPDKLGRYNYEGEPEE